MDEENKEQEVEQLDAKEIIETYEFFANPITANISHHKGIRLILEKLVNIENKLKEIEEKTNGSQE